MSQRKRSKIIDLSENLHLTNNFVFGRTLIQNLLVLPKTKTFIYLYFLLAVVTIINVYIFYLYVYLYPRHTQIYNFELTNLDQFFKKYNILFFLFFFNAVSFMQVNDYDIR